MPDLLSGLVWYGALLFSLTFHEAAHAWAALRGGDPTAYLGGQVSLDPRPHIRREPMGMVWVPLFFFATGGMMLGWASTPYDPRWAERYPRRAAWMALAGPASNALLVLASAAAIHLGLASGVFAAPDYADWSHVTVAVSEQGIWPSLALGISVLFSLNLLLCIFNLIPLPPLDGSGAIPLFVNESLARRYRVWVSHPAFAIGGILIAWFTIGPVFRELHGVAMNLLYPGIHYR